MCILSSKPTKPRPALIERPAPVLDQEAPEATDEASKKARKKRTGTKAYRAGSNLTIPTQGSSSSPLNIAG